MIIEYCDRCGKVIDEMNSKHKNTLAIIVASNERCQASANIVLCKECFDEMGITEKVKALEASQAKKEKEPVEKFYDLFKNWLKNAARI